MNKRGQRVFLCTAALAAVACLGLIIPLRAQENQDPSAGKRQTPYALIFGTVYDPAGHTVYGVKVTIHRADAKKPHWELVSDHQGEFAQRVPAGKAEYVVMTEVKKTKTFPFGPAPQKTVQIENEERQDIALHLTE